MIIKKLGVVICLIALIGSLFLGVLTNTSTSTSVTTEYDYVADMSQTFQYSTLPDYTEYNPISNYTGYLRSDGRSPGVSFTTATGASNYRMANEITSTTVSKTMDELVTNDTTITPPNGTTAGIMLYVDHPSATKYTVVYVDQPNVVKLSDLISAVQSGAPAGTTNFTIDLSSSDTYAQYGGLGKNIVILRDRNFWTNANMTDYPGSTNRYDKATEWELWQNRSDPTILTVSYDVFTSATTINQYGYTSSVNLDDYYVYWLNSASTYKLEERATTSYPIGWHSDTIPGATASAEITYDTITYSFMKINDGVKVNNTDNTMTTDWSNDYKNGIIDVVFGRNNETMSNTFTLDYTSSNDDPTFTVSRTTDGPVTINDGTNTYTIGTWDYFMLHIDALNGQLSVYPVTSFTNYTQFNTSSSPVTFGSLTYLTIPTGTIDGIKYDYVTASVPSFTLSVADTTIQATSKLLMVNPSIDINDYFTNADTDGWRLNFYSFATIGTSMTVNGQTFPVSDGKITVGGRTLKLTNIYVSYDKLDNHIYFTWANDRVTVDLGEWTTSTISMTGTWFFNTGYYTSETTTTTSTDILWTQIPPFGTVAIFFIALTLILMAIGIKKFGFETEDYIITITALAVAFCVLEAFM